MKYTRCKRGGPLSVKKSFAWNLIHVCRYEAVCLTKCILCESRLQSNFNKSCCHLSNSSVCRLSTGAADFNLYTPAALLTFYLNRKKTHSSSIAHENNCTLQNNWTYIRHRDTNEFILISLNTCIHTNRNNRFSPKLDFYITSGNVAELLP